MLFMPSSIATRQTLVELPQPFTANTLIGRTYHVLVIYDIYVRLQNIIYTHDFFAHIL